MNITFMGIVRTHGTKNAGGTWDSTNLLAIIPVENIERGNFNQTGFGHMVEEHAIDPVIVDDFKDCEMGDVLDVEFGPVPGWKGRFQIERLRK
jgi:hypothetical protein